jgi:hypothetical protein
VPPESRQMYPESLLSSRRDRVMLAAPFGLRL